jgi:hypothetical protein
MPVPMHRYIRSDRAPVEALVGREHSPVKDCQAAEASSAELRERLGIFFRKWERRHGFQEGAGAKLVPAGYDPERKP